ncbi:phosphate/phosphite/phosphonate ABC transporter substrate-binding protein [Pseudoduganella umbonata]|uniref:Phosphate/phosphite/phosphonate ABC transporter substrate-binding protein n=1 Tax=Pseudoduganella umbonata TaxID=864828 RepID=A0A4P8HMB7_9BURK|nr:PhnD/SsuA/transferrin family substrate-binding protein [Pseudoduganella umbonata]MBB3219481.1 phosphonate transport system substrate-binding protein [Pseudoduganella umbonata]QCP09564.1 phosphate/phosphite/phosphonate ABC transporter substrate-binding protein [Pseudoduganella umbonata]
MYPIRTAGLFAARSFAALLLAACLAPAASASATDSEAVYQFSPVNQHNVQITASYWNPIIDYVSQASGVTLRLKLGRTSADTTSFVLAQEVDFAFTNHLFAPERARMGWRVLARRTGAAVRSQIVTLAGSAVRDLKDLADADVAFPGPEATVAYQVSHAELQRRGIPVHVVFGGNMDGAFAQLISGKARAVGANSQLTASFINRHRTPLRVLWQSAPFNDLALMVSPRVPAATAEAVARAFTAMADDPRGRRVLADAAALVKTAPFSFVPADESDYESYREFYGHVPAERR